VCAFGFEPWEGLTRGGLGKAMQTKGEAKTPPGQETHLPFPYPQHVAPCLAISR
jgi:hypothetical protein